MAQDNTPAIVMYKGPQEDGYSIPFDKGFYGEVKVAFVRRGLTDYEYNPTAYSVDGALYAWEISAGVYYYTKSASPAVDATVYNSGNQEISGVKVVSTQDASASFSDGKTGIRSNKKDIHSHALLFWTGEPLGDDDWICIVRETVKKQPYSYPNNQKHIEGALDNLSRQIQELKAQSDVSLKVDPTFVQDPAKMNPIDWLNTIVRSTDTTARGLRYRNFWLEYSTDDPNKAESDKSWTKLLNTTNVTTIRQVYNEETNEYYFQYSMDGGASWLSVGLSKADIDKIIDEANAYSDEQNALLENRINGKLTEVTADLATRATKTELENAKTVLGEGIQGNADAILKTRNDYEAADQAIRDDMNAEDGRLQSQITAHVSAITTNKNDIDELGDQVAEIESKIPESASATNQLATKSDLANIDLDGYVKKSGDTMTGDLVLDGHGASGLGPVINFVGLGPNPSNGQEFITTIDTFRGYGLSIKDYVDGEVRNVLNFSDGFWGYSYINDKMLNSGSSLYPWKTTYTQVLNAGNKIVGDTTSEFSGDLIVPSEGGTLARMEDLIDLRADINKADSELQTQITHQAAEIATKQDQLVAGDNIVISNNVISATGAGGGVGFDAVVVQELPATGQKGIIYLLAKDGAAPDVYDEYVWIESTQTFELIGTTQVDLTGYVKNTDYATSTTGGVIKTINSFSTAADGSGYLYASTKTQDAYSTGSNNMFVGKGTLENIKKDLVERAVSEDGATLSGYVKNTDYATSTTVGVVFIGNTSGLGVSTGGNIHVLPATETVIDAKKSGNRAVTMNKLDYAVKVGVTTNTIALTDEEKAAAQAWLGVESGGGASLPDQTDNAGKVLSTNGTDAEWTDMPGLIIRSL